MKLSYAIIGTGALGGYYGGRLAHHGHDTHFLLHSDFEHVREHGLKVDSVRGGFLLTPEQIQAYGHPTDLPACDVTVVALKTTHNHLLPKLLQSSVSGGGVVLVLQNGLSPEADAAKIVGDDRVLGGLCFLCSNKVGPGHIDHSDYGHIHLGRYCDRVDPDIWQQIVADFNAADIETQAVDDLRLARWKKLAWNVPYNGLSVVLNQTTDQLMSGQESRSRVEALMKEVQAAARAVDGRDLDDAFREKLLDYTAKMTPYKTSMMLDHEAGRPLETESIVGDPLRAAQAAGCDVPEMSRLYEQLLAIDRG